MHPYTRDNNQKLAPILVNDLAKQRALQGHMPTEPMTSGVTTQSGSGAKSGH